MLLELDSNRNCVYFNQPFLCSSQLCQLITTCFDPNASVSFALFVSLSFSVCCFISFFPCFLSFLLVLSVFAFLLSLIHFCCSNDFDL